MTTKMQEVLNEAQIPANDETLVWLHANLLINTVGYRPSEAAQHAVREYRALGTHDFRARHYADNRAALQACGCPACSSDAQAEIDREAMHAMADKIYADFVASEAN